MILDNTLKLLDGETLDLGAVGLGSGKPIKAVFRCAEITGVTPRASLTSGDGDISTNSRLSARVTGPIDGGKDIYFTLPSSVGTHILASLPDGGEVYLLLDGQTN